MTDAGLVVDVRQPGPIALDAQFACAPGEMLALVGPSGAGKTTLLRAVAGLYRPAAGRISCNGVVWHDAQPRIFVAPHLRSAGLVFQSYALFPHMTALANIEAAIGFSGDAHRRARALDLMERLHLSGLEHRKPSQLSGGQQQRVALARALARDPAVLLLDEPFSAVDKPTRGRLHAELAELRRGLSIPILLVTHDFDEAARLADRMALLDAGRIIQSGAPLDVLARPASVAAARLVDLRNLFDGVVEGHDGDHTRLRWAGGVLRARPARREFAPGARVAWSAPSTQVLLHRDDASAAPADNVLDGVVVAIARLSEATSLTVAAGGRDGPRFTMTTPAHYAQRTQLREGDPIQIHVAEDAINLMPPG